LVTALLLCGVIGPLGAHRFYVGKILTGTLQLLMTLSILGWVLVDFPYHNGEFDFVLLLEQMLTLLFAGAWPSADFALLLCGKFKDGAGNIVRE
jgi:hypothetical protein